VNQKYDVIILGAGAAGLMCAIEAGKRGRRVLVLERADRIGKKILISGGGRCNFTNLHTSPENFFSANPHFAKSALARYTPADFVRLVEKHRIPYHEKKLGQLFCDRAASDITAMLEQECRDAGVEIRCNTKVIEVRKNEVQKTDQFTVQSEDSNFGATRLVVATGGLSIAKIGATSFGYDLARQFGLKIEPPRAALVPLLFSERDCKRCAIWQESQPRWLLSPAARSATLNNPFAKTCCSLIAASAGPRFSKSLLTGMARNRFISTLRPAAISPPICESVATATNRVGNCY